MPFWRATGAAPVLPYGQVLRADGLSCVVAESGVSCRSDALGNGLTVSTNGYECVGAEGTALNAQDGTLVTAHSPRDVAAIVAFDLGGCGGAWMHRSVV